MTPPDASLRFQAFADVTRLRLLNLLRRGETCVGDLVAVLGLPQPTVSRHLGILRRAGLVGARTRARWRYYRLLRPHGDLHERLVGCLEGCLREVPELQADAERASRLAKAGGCCPTGGADGSSRCGCGQPRSLGTNPAPRPRPSERVPAKERRRGVVA